MNQDLLITSAVCHFRESINCELVVLSIRRCSEHIAPWVLERIDKGGLCALIVTDILIELFADCVYEHGESTARKSTARWREEAGCYDPLGEVLQVAEMEGHLWITWECSGSPLGHIEFSYMDNDNEEE